MNRNDFALLTYLLLMASYFVQGGASLFATTVSVATMIEAPPRSLSMVQGEFGFDPDIFWNVFPTIGFVFFVLALAANWRGPRRHWIIGGWLVGLVGALVAIFLLGPVQETLLSSTYSDAVDPRLRATGLLWFRYSVAFSTLSFLAGLVLILGLLKHRPGR